MVTKTGKTGAFLEYSREPKVNTILFDFDIESSRLKQLHRGYIEKVLAPMIITKGMLVPWKLKVVGHTSASGSKSYNKALSRRRAQAVADHVRLHTPMRAVHIEVDGAGEEYAKGWEDWLDRAVHVSGGPAGGVDWTPDPPRAEDVPLPPRAGEAQLFHLRFLKVSKVAFGIVGKLNLTVEITDRFKLRPHRYRFEGTELSLSLSPLKNIKVQAGVSQEPSRHHTFWSRPELPRIMSTGDFGGAAKISKGWFLGHNSFHFGGMHAQSWTEYECMVQPLVWEDPSFLNLDLVGIVEGPMRSVTIDL